MAVRSVNLFSTTQRLFGSKDSIGDDVNGGWYSESGTFATMTLTLSGCNNGTYTDSADKRFTKEISGVTYTFTANADFTVSGGAATVACTASERKKSYNDTNNGGLITASTTFTGSTSVMGSGTATAGAITGGSDNTILFLAEKVAPYNVYVPGNDSYKGNSLGLLSPNTNQLVIYSPVVSCEPSRTYDCSFTLGVSSVGSILIQSELIFYEALGGSALQIDMPGLKTSTQNETLTRFAHKAFSPSNGNFVQQKLTISAASGSLSVGDYYALYDPVIGDVSVKARGNVGKIVYADLPQFMRLDDENIVNLDSGSGRNLTTGTLTLASCANGTYPAGTEFSVVQGNVNLKYESTGEFTVSGGAATVKVIAKREGVGFNDVAHGGILPNGSASFSNTNVGGTGTVTAGTGDVNGFIGGSDGNTQRPFPLRGFVDCLTHAIEIVYDSARNFDYIHATEGTLSKSTLTDPLTAPAGYLTWLASITGTTLLSSASGFTPWTALESFQAAGTSTPGEWADLETLASWNVLQALDPDFFDTISSYRNQINTGFSGIHAGKKLTIDNFLQTLLETETPANHVSIVRKNDFNNPFKLQTLVDPAVDPDVGGTLVSDAVSNGAPAGAIASSTNNVIDAADGSYDFTALLNSTTGQGKQVLGDHSAGSSAPHNYREFIDDRDGFNRSILLTTTTGNLGGGIGTSQYTGNKVYLYGESGKLTVANDATFNLGGDDTAVDIIVELTNFTPFAASAWTSNNTATSGQPDDWFLREKRLLVCGTDTTSNHNDWAFYIVSGHTASADSKMRLLWIEGYRDENETNYAYSSELDMSTIQQYGPVVFRVSKSASDVVTFYAQSSLYDDWASNALTSTPSTAITPSSQAASTAGNAGIQVGGTLSNSLWSDASALPAAFSRVMVNNAVFTFTGSGSTSSENHAYVDGDGVNDFGNTSYTPLLDIDPSKASAVYAESFNATKTVSGTASNKTVTVGQDGVDNDVTLVAMEPDDTHGNLWYFGSQDTLAVSGLPSASYKIRITEYDDSDGSVNNYIDIGAATATTFSFAGGTYGDKTIFSIDVVTAAGTYGTNGAQSSNSVAYFRPDTIGAAANPLSATGTDNKSKTWTLTRATASNSTNWIPSQAIDKSFIQPYKGKFTTAEPPAIEYYTPFSVAMQIKRCWTSSGTGTEHNIYSLLNGSNQGLKIFYEDATLKAVFTDGTASETATFTQTSFGGWDNVVVQRDPNVGLSIYVNGTLAETATHNATIVPFSASTNAATFSEGTNSQYNPWFALSQFAFYNRFLSTTEIALLNTQLT
tara:strand:+ start:118 stop:4005 length:3888 start_codon:yes stop_codon:yes gene_type:complete